MARHRIDDDELESKGLMFLHGEIKTPLSSDEKRKAANP